MKKRGRPWVYSRAVGEAVAESIASGSSKKQACAEAGIAYSSFMRWQRQKRSLRRSLEEAVLMWRNNQRIERDLKVLLSEEPVELDNCSHRHNRSP
jgi:transposase-like protein